MRALAEWSEAAAQVCREAPIEALLSGERPNAVKRMAAELLLQVGYTSPSQSCQATARRLLGSMDFVSRRHEPQTQPLSLALLALACPVDEQGDPEARRLLRRCATSTWPDLQLAAIDVWSQQTFAGDESEATLLADLCLNSSETPNVRIAALDLLSTSNWCRLHADQARIDLRSAFDRERSIPVRQRMLPLLAAWSSPEEMAALLPIIDDLTQEESASRSGFGHATQVLTCCM